MAKTILFLQMFLIYPHFCSLLFFTLFSSLLIPSFRIFPYILSSSFLLFFSFYFSTFLFSSSSRHTFKNLWFHNVSWWILFGAIHHAFKLFLSHNKAPLSIPHHLKLWLHALYHTWGSFLSFDKYLLSLWLIASWKNLSLVTYHTFKNLLVAP